MALLDDLLPDELRSKQPEKAKGTKAAAAQRTKPAPEKKSYNMAVVIFWDRFVCRCGAEHEGPRPGYHPAYFKRWNGQRQVVEYPPISRSDGQPDPTLPHEVSLREQPIMVCPWCAPAFDGYPDEDAFQPPTVEMPDPASEQDDDDILPLDEQYISSCGDASLDELLEQEEDNDGE